MRRLLVFLVVTAAVAVMVVVPAVGADAAVVREQFQIASPDGQIVFSLNSKSASVLGRSFLGAGPNVARGVARSRSLVST